MDYNFREIMKRIIKYLVIAIVVAVACVAIPKRAMDLEEIALIALVAAATFSILDTYAPRI
jgi:ABC-type Co2+ transport system permease subunit